jgi:hypothetical protein
MITATSAFIQRIAQSLLPFFLATTPNAEEAGIAIVQALNDYGARTESEFTEAAQILALGFCTVDTLAESAAPGLSVNKRLRLRGSAAALVRSKKTCQQALTSSLGTEHPDSAQPDSAERDPIETEPQQQALNTAMQRLKDRLQGHEIPTEPATPHANLSPTAQAQTQKQKNAMLWAGVMSQVADTLVRDNGPAPKPA